MLLYWAIFTLGFFAGSILAFVVFAPKNPEEDPEYETPQLFSQAPKTINGELVDLLSTYSKKSTPTQKSQRDQSNQIAKVNRKWFPVN